MRKIIAIIKPHQLNLVKESIKKKIKGMSITEVKGFGRQKGQSEIYRGAEYHIDFVPKIQIEVYCEAEEADWIVEQIENQAKTGKMGDGKIFVTKVLDAYRIRTGERGKEQVFHE